MATTDNEDTKPENVFMESVIVFGLILLVKQLNKLFKESKSIIPTAATIAFGYYVIMYIVSRVRPCMCKNIRNSITWAAGQTLGGF